MNVIDEQKVKDTIVDPALSRIETVVIPALELALQRQIYGASQKVAGIVTGALTGLGGLLSQADGDASRLLAGLDGWTLEIEVPKIRVRLTGPGGLTSPKALE